jgi:hypothetical protein
MINKNSIVLLFTFLFFSCGSKKPIVLEEKKLYDILLRKEEGGAKFRFYEIISEEKEFRMIANDEYIKPYLEKEEFKKSNFILVNLGLKDKSGYEIRIDKAVETANKISLRITELEPKNTENTISGDFTPNFVIRVKSKKAIEIIE